MEIYILLFILKFDHHLTYLKNLKQNIIKFLDLKIHAFFRELETQSFNFKNFAFSKHFFIYQIFIFIFLR